MRFYYFLLFVLVLLYGCVGPLESYYRDSVSKVAKFLDPLHGGSFILKIKGDVEDKSYALLCDKYNYSSSFGFIYRIFFDPAILGQKCYVKELNESVLESIERDDVLVRTVDIGVGSSIYDFDDAVVFCNNSMRYAVQYIYGDGDSFFIPNKDALASSANCLTYRSILPVYVLFSDRINSPTAVDDFVDAVKDNPSIVIFFDGYDEEYFVSNVGIFENSLARIKNGCDKCVVFFSLPFGNDTILDVVNSSNIPSIVDGYAFLIDSNKVDIHSGRELSAFSRGFFYLIKYYWPDKPIFIYGTKLNMTDAEAVRFYNDIFNSFSLLAPFGLVGYVGEDFYGDSKKGLFFTDRNEFKFSTFFSNCQLYYSLRPYTAIYSLYGLEGLKSFSLRTEPIGVPIYYGKEGIKELDKPPFVVSSPAEKIMDCTVCINSDPTYFVNLGVPQTTVSSGFCSSANVFAVEASRLMLDPAVVAALYYMFNSEDSCYIEAVPSYLTNFCEMPRRISTLNTRSCSLPLLRFNINTGECDERGSGEVCYVCRYGKFRVPYPPSSNGAPTLVKKICGDDFDPFDEEDAACGAAVAFYEYYSKFKNIVGDGRSFYMDGKDYYPSLLTLSALAYFSNYDRAKEFLYLSREVARASDCSSLSSNAKDFCCVGDDMENNLCGRKLSPAELFVGLFREMPTTIGAQKWRVVGDDAYKFLQAYVSVSKSCKMCDRKGSNRLYCNFIKFITGRDVCGGTIPPN